MDPRCHYLVAVVKIDPSAEAAYVRVDQPHGDVAQTIPASVNIDLDADGHVVGIEILDWPS
jgi:uncharacterized protein YuzE